LKADRSHNEQLLVAPGYGIRQISVGNQRVGFGKGGFMKRTWIAGMMSGVLAVALAACGGGGGGGGGGGDTNACGSSTQGCVIGTVVDAASGAAVGGAIVTTGGAAAASVIKAAGTTVATANSQGWFSATGIEQGTDVTFCFQGTGYATTCYNYTIDGAKTLNMPPVKMLKKGAPLTFSATTGGVITDAATGASMTIPANAVCASDRSTAATGTITCTLTPITTIDSAPGSFTGIAADGTEVALLTAGMMDISCQDGGQNPVNLCTGKTASVVIPMFGSEDCATQPTTMSSWDFDETTGVWREVGTLTRSACGAANSYAGNVTHWSWWNADRPEHFSCLSGRVMDATGTTANGQATVYCELSEGAGKPVRLRRSAQTDSDGNFCVNVVRGAYYSCKAEKGEFKSDPKTGTASTEQAACGGSGCTDIGTLTLADPLFRTTLTWGSQASGAPRDLDSHFVSRDGGVQVFYNNKAREMSVTKGTLTGPPYVALDTDDTDWEGPENTTVVPGVAAGTYRFCVNNYSFGETGEMSTSGAEIIVSGQGSNFPRRYTVPEGAATTNVWQVYEVTIGSDNALAFTDLNKLVTATSPTDETSVLTACFE
jgi:hypothetical protein